MIPAFGHEANDAPSRLHSKVNCPGEVVCVSLPEYVKLAEVLVVVPAGFVPMAVSGGVRSMNQSVCLVPPPSVNCTKNECGPSLSPL